MAMPEYAGDAALQHKGTFSVNVSSQAHLAAVLRQEPNQAWNMTCQHGLRHSEAGKGRAEGTSNRFIEMDRPRDVRGVFPGNLDKGTLPQAGKAERRQQWYQSLFARGFRPTRATCALLCELSVTRGDPEGVLDVISMLDDLGMEVDESHYASLLAACANVYQHDVVRAEHGLRELVRRGLNLDRVKQCFIQTVGATRASVVFDTLSQACVDRRACNEMGMVTTRVTGSCRYGIGEDHDSEAPGSANRIYRSYVGRCNAWTGTHDFAQQPTPGGQQTPVLNAMSAAANFSQELSSDGFRAAHPHAQKPRAPVAECVLATTPSRLGGISVARARDASCPHRQAPHVNPRSYLWAEARQLSL